MVLLRGADHQPAAPGRARVARSHLRDPTRQGRALSNHLKAMQDLINRVNKEKV